VELTVKLLQESRAKGNPLPPMTTVEAAKSLAGLQIVIAIGELVDVPCDIIIEEIHDILEQHPELWGSVDELVEKKLAMIA